ncbi:hypothetical protein NL459_28950, partial [Klebsiella pneumoniae]|nr:hypothetical protein [Klebsiella pneumoniae]
QEEESDAEEENAQRNKVAPMEIDANETAQSTTQPTRAPSPSVKVEPAAPLPAPEDFFASIDTSILPSKIQALISSFSSSP